MPETVSIRDAVRTVVAETTKAMAEHVPGIGLADIQMASATLQSATAMALLYVGDQIREQVEVQRQQLEQQKLTNVLTAIGRSNGAGGDMLGRDLEEAAVEYIRARIGDIVNPTPESESSGFDRDSELEEFDGFKQMSGGGGE
jgi:hypothetical protein